MKNEDQAVNKNGNDSKNTIENKQTAKLDRQNLMNIIWSNVFVVIVIILDLGFNFFGNNNSSLFRTICVVVAIGAMDVKYIVDMVYGKEIHVALKWFLNILSAAGLLLFIYAMWKY